MKSARRFAIVALMMIAGSLLLTEARCRGEEYPSQPHHRHRHHRNEISSGSSSNSAIRKNYDYWIAMKQHSSHDEDKDYEDEYEIFEEKSKGTLRNLKLSLDEEENGDDENDGNEYEDEIEHNSDRYYPRRRNLHFGSTRDLDRGHRTRPDTRLYHISNYPLRNHDSSINVPEVTKDEIEEYDEYVRSLPLSRWNNRQHHSQRRSRHQRPQHQQQQQQQQQHHHHHSQFRRQQHTHNKDNELLFSSRSKNSYFDVIPKSEVKGNKYRSSLRKKLKHKTNYSNISYTPYQNTEKSLERKWRNSNIQRGEKLEREIESVKNDDDEEDIWLDGIGDYDEDVEGDDENDDFDINDYFDEANENYQEKPPYKTYDEIIKRLTSNEPTTQQPSKASMKRDYRNIEIEKFLKEDAYGNLQYHPTNNSKLIDSNNNKIVKNITSNFDEKNLNILNNSTSRKNETYNLKKLNISKLQTRSKRLEQEYEDEYDNEEKKKEPEVPEVPEDDEEDDDNDGKNETVTTLEYSMNENESETSVPVTITTTPYSMTMPTTITPALTKATVGIPVITTTSTQKPYDRRDSRANNSTNALQTTRVTPKWQTKEVKVQPQSKKNVAEFKEALQHAIKVSREGSCQWPRARVIPVRDVYPSPSTTYIPHCAILHRCSDDTGCCRSEALTCVPKHTHRVELHFYMTNVGGGSVVEKLSFYNHTECECREKRNYGKQSEKQPPSLSSTNEQHTIIPTISNKQHQITLPPENIRIPPQKKPCRCPSEFTPRITSTGECLCKCFENDQDCIHARRGKGYFSLRDRLCIQNEECAVPACEFGEYMIRQGKCPKKKDKFDSIANYPNNMNNYPRLRR